MSLMEAWENNSSKAAGQLSGTAVPAASVAHATDAGAIFSLEPFDAQITRYGTCRSFIDNVCVELAPGDHARD